MSVHYVVNDVLRNFGQTNILYDKSFFTNVNA